MATNKIDAAKAFLMPVHPLFPAAGQQALTSAKMRPSPVKRPNFLSRFKPFWALCCEWKKTIFVVVIYAITVSIAATASQRHTLLGSVSPPLGVWFLNILSKLTDIAFGFFVDEIWEKVQWSLLAKKRTLNLSVFFALSSTTDFAGSWKILTHGWQRWLDRIKKKKRVVQPPDPNTGRARRWSFAKILVAMCIAGPGIIITADINTKTLYFPIEHHNISGGIGHYNSTYPPIFQDSPGTSTSSLVQTLLRDVTISFPVDPVSAECIAAGSSCKSYIIPGGLGTVSPWPFPRLTNPEITAFQTENTPTYQIDLWDGPAGVTWAPSDCHIYGDYKINAFQICIAEYPNKPGHLVSSWRVCPTEVTASRECNQNNSWAGSQIYTTSMVAYRRLATVTALQKDLSILDVTDLGEPTIQSEAQGISPKDLFIALDTLVYHSDSTTAQSDCKSSKPSFQLYVFIGTRLDLLRADQAQALRLPLDLLRNLLVMPLYLYNDLIMRPGSAIPAIDTVQTGLPAENYIQGAYIIASTRSIPGTWTVWTYASIGAVVLVTGFIVQLLLLRDDVPKSSGNPVVDFISFTECHDDNSGSNPDNKWNSSAFVNDDLTFKKGSLLGTLANLNVGLKHKLH
ncbi:hypothetical protein TWF694_006280 [Orbilia ellipsospora]|uniref:Uncharacterized protein n=1 Tax=Orbilia ellipsospora TaxID=2528407 RepID=A0AAV9XL29_9PEZI